MKRLAKTLVGVFALMLLSVFAAGALLQRVPPAKIGVKQNLLGGGIESSDYLMGFHLGVSFVHKWHLLDGRMHFLTYARSEAAVNRKMIGMGVVRPALEIRTKDNNLAFFDVTVTYRIKPGEGHRIVQAGNQVKYRLQADTAVQAVLRAELAQLSSEEVYDTDTRLSLVDSVMPKLAAELAKYHLEPSRLLIRAVAFPEQYEQKLTEKQLTYQQKLLASAQRKVEDEQAETEGYETETMAMVKEASADWDLKLEVLRSDNRVLIAGITAEAEKDAIEMTANADADYLAAIAEGELAVQKAEALRNELRNQALDTAGGRIFLAQQAAENLQFDSVTLNSNDPSIPSILNIDELVRLLVGERE